MLVGGYENKCFKDGAQGVIGICKGVVIVVTIRIKIIEILYSGQQIWNIDFVSSLKRPTRFGREIGHVSSIQFGDVLCPVLIHFILLTDKWLLLIIPL